MAERRMIDLNNRLVAANHSKDEMSMRLRELEEIVQSTIKREMDLGIKERQIEQVNHLAVRVFSEITQKVIEEGFFT